MAMNQEANTPLVLTIGAVSALLIIVIMFGVEAWFRYEEREELTRLWDESPDVHLIQLRAAQKAHLEESRVDPKSNAVHIPIEKAMGAIVESHGKLPATQPATAG
jgi:hypothetical protein